MKKKTKIILIISFVIVFMTSFLLFCFWRYRDRDYTITIQEQETSNQEAPDTLNIATYNVKLLNNGTDLDKFINDIEGLDLDIIALQEVDKNAGRSNNMDMVREMAEGAGYEYYYFYESMWLFDGSYGLGIISKYPILEVTSTELPAGTFSEPRILAGAKIDVNGEILHIYNTHLNYFNRGIRDSQVDAITDIMKNQENTIFMGDMNNFFVEDIYTIDGFQSLNTKDRTFVTFRESAFTDNIYYSDNLEVTDIIVTDTSFSDHRLFWCVVRLEK
jgi:endonuclease/exonuclease/phosphatase family metal-dependent hydrolase